MFDEDIERVVSITTTREDQQVEVWNHSRERGKRVGDPGTQTGQWFRTTEIEDFYRSDTDKGSWLKDPTRT